MGLSKSSTYFTAFSTSFIPVSLFDLQSRFFAPTRSIAKPARAGAVKVGRRTNLAACIGLARPHLDSSEHDGTLDAVGMTIGGEPAFGRGSIAPQPCIRWVQDPTMMQPCASAAKLRSGGPILPVGVKAKGLVGAPPPRTVIGAPSQACGQGRNYRDAFSVLRSLCRTHNDAVRDNTLPHEPPQGDQ